MLPARGYGDISVVELFCRYKVSSVDSESGKQKEDIKIYLCIRKEPFIKESCFGTEIYKGIRFTHQMMLCCFLMSLHLPLVHLLIFHIQY